LALRPWLIFSGEHGAHNPEDQKQIQALEMSASVRVLQKCLFAALVYLPRPSCSLVYPWPFVIRVGATIHLKA
jgi:hypothetical protein